VIEGHYSMDGDAPDLAAFVALARKHRAWLLVDEAHAIGVLGATGMGVAERCGVDPARGRSVDGHAQQVAGVVRRLHRRQARAGRVPEILGARLRLLGRHDAAERRRGARSAAHPAQGARARRQGERQLHPVRDKAKAAGLDTGPSVGASIVPIIAGGSIRAGRFVRRAVQARHQRPADPLPGGAEPMARLRFFLSSEHTEDQILHAVEVMAEEDKKVGSEEMGMVALSSC